MKTSHTPSNPRVLIAGANGFIGQHLLENLWKKYDITAISRRQVLKEVKSKFSSVEWVQADFFSRSQTIDALKAADIGIYLIHSMSPTSEFERGRFQNRDLLLADNFLYAAAKNNLKQIIFVGGQIPQNQMSLSDHLKSRQEVESLFRTGEIPVTVLRTSMIFGAGGSSSDILFRLIQRLPILILQKYLENTSRPIYIIDLVRSVEHCFLNSETYNRHFNISGNESLSYRDMLMQISSHLGYRRFFLNIPWLPLTLCKLFASFFSQTPLSLVGPLLETTKHDLDLPSDEINRYKVLFSSTFKQLIKDSLKEDKGCHNIIIPKSTKKSLQRYRTVRSVDRIFVQKSKLSLAYQEIYTLAIEILSIFN